MHCRDQQLVCLVELLLLCCKVLLRSRSDGSKRYTVHSHSGCLLMPCKGLDGVGLVHQGLAWLVFFCTEAVQRFTLIYVLSVAGRLWGYVIDSRLFR